VPLRKLTIEIELPTSATTGKCAKMEHARMVGAVYRMLENEAWGAFSVPLYDSAGQLAGHAVLRNYPKIVPITAPPMEFPSHGDREQIDARPGRLRA
jgi:hypothetical protein